MRESDRFFGLRTQHQRYHLLSAATLNNSRNRNFVHRKDHGRIEAGIPGSPRPHRRRRTSRSNLGQRWPSRLVATAAADCLSKKQKPARYVTRRFVLLPKDLVTAAPKARIVKDAF